MKNQHLLYALLTLMAFGLITACSKSSNSTPTPNSPIVGQFDINRVEYTDYPTSFSVYNGIDTVKAHLGTDTYIFKNDNTFTNSYNVRNSAGVITGLNTDTGGYMYTASTSTSTSTITLTPTPASGQSPQPYGLYYNGTTNEVFTGKIPGVDSLATTTGGVKQAVPYSYNIVYKKK